MEQAKSSKDSEMKTLDLEPEIKTLLGKEIQVLTAVPTGKLEVLFLLALEALIAEEKDSDQMIQDLGLEAV